MDEVFLGLQAALAGEYSIERELDDTLRDRLTPPSLARG